MEREKIKGIIEGILFASGRPVTLQELQTSLEIKLKEITNIISEMQEEYKDQKRGIEIVKVDDKYTLSSKKEYHEYIYSIIDKRVKPSLSQAALEVLAIIAYNPQITRAEIENIRGVNSDASMYRLLEHNLIEEAGKLDMPGKPMSYKTTTDFLKMFGYNTLADLPELPKYKMDENQQIVIDDLIKEQEKTENQNNEKIEEQDKEKEQEQDKEVEQDKEEGEDNW